MTDIPIPKKPRTRNANTPLGAGEAFDRLCERRDTLAERRSHHLDRAAREFDATECEAHDKLIARCAQRSRLEIMLRALPIAERLARETIASPAPSGSLTAPPDAPLPKGALPLTPERIAIGKGR